MTARTKRVALLAGFCGCWLWATGALAQLPSAAQLVLVPAPSPMGYVPLPNLGFLPLPCLVDPDCNEQMEVITGLDFFYLGRRYDRVEMSTNGFLAIDGNGADPAPINQSLPDPTAPNNLLAPFWTDFDLLDSGLRGLGGGFLFYGDVVSGLQTYHVFEWQLAQLFGGTGEEFTFQIWIERGTANIWFVYQNLPLVPVNLTVGAEDSTAGFGVSRYFDGTGMPPVVGEDLKLEVRLTLDFDQLAAGTAVTDQLPVVSFATDPGFEVQTTAVDLGSSLPNIICTVPVAVGATCVNRLVVDFSPPVSGLSFVALGLKNTMAAAQIDIYENDVFSVTVDIPAPGLGPVLPPFTVFLPFVSNVTRIEIYNIDDTAGIGWDDFSFVFAPRRLGEIFADGFESGDTAAWTLSQP